MTDFWQRSTYRYVIADSFDVNIVKDHIFRANKEGRPARRIQQSETIHLNVGSVVSQEEDRAVIRVRRALTCALGFTLSDTRVFNHTNISRPAKPLYHA